MRHCAFRSCHACSRRAAFSPPALWPLIRMDLFAEIIAATIDAVLLLMTT
jgi:hypothetical protein